MTTSDNDDRELDQYLAGKDGLTRQYKSVAGESPPQHIDEAVLAASRKAVAAKPRRVMPPWSGRLDAPLAIAAVVVLSVLVIFNLPDETVMLPSEADMDDAATSTGPGRLNAIEFELPEDRPQQRKSGPGSGQSAESAEIQATSASPAITPAAPAMDTATQEGLSANMAAGNAQTIVDLQKSMRMQTEEQIANSESARMRQPPPEIVVAEPAQMDTYTDSALVEAARSQFTACVTPRPEVCTMEYLPVCATRDTGIRCVTTPCDSAELVEFSNACSACGDPDVIGYTPGPCPATE